LHYWRLERQKNYGRVRICRREQGSCQFIGLDEVLLIFAMVYSRRERRVALRCMVLEKVRGMYRFGDSSSLFVQLHCVTPKYLSGLAFNHPTSSRSHQIITDAPQFFRIRRLM